MAKEFAGIDTRSEILRILKQVSGVSDKDKGRRVAGRIAGIATKLRRLTLHQNPGETLHIRQLENGLGRPCGRSRPTPWRFVSLVGTDAFAGALTRGNLGTIPETIKIEDTQRFREVLWLGDLDSNQD
jgi:hypothetical protein